VWTGFIWVYLEINGLLGCVHLASRVFLKSYYLMRFQCSTSSTSHTCLPVYNCIPTDDTTPIIIGQRIRPFDRTAFRSPHKRHPGFGMPIVRPQRGAVPTLALWSRLGLRNKGDEWMTWRWLLVRLGRVCCWLVFVNRSQTTCTSVSDVLTGASVSRDTRLAGGGFMALLSSSRGAR
jgi:hypothetical protein